MTTPPGTKIDDGNSVSQPINQRSPEIMPINIPPLQIVRTPQNQGESQPNHSAKREIGCQGFAESHSPSALDLSFFTPGSVENSNLLDPVSTSVNVVISKYRSPETCQTEDPETVLLIGKNDHAVRKRGIEFRYSENSSILIMSISGHVTPQALPAE